MVGLHVRVPDAQPDAGRAPWQCAARSLPRRGVGTNQVCAGPSGALGHVRVGLCRARPHAGLPIRAPRRAEFVFAPHAAQRARGRALCDRLGGANRPHGRLQKLRHPGGAHRLGPLRFHRRAGLHPRTPSQRRALHPGGHLHGPPPGHDTRGAGQCAARWRGPALGHGQPTGSGSVVLVARTGATRGAAPGHLVQRRLAARRTAASAQHAARGHAGGIGRAAHACVIQWPLQRAAARQRRWQQPVGGGGHHTFT